MTAAITVSQLTKRFENIEAVNNVSFSVNKGELFGFLGPNGAGKTTTINMITGLARPTSGQISVAGVDCIARPRGAQHLMGVVPDESNLYPELTGFENLSFCGALYGMRKQERRKRAHELLATFGLAKAKDRKFGAYSKGMKRKLTIAAAMIHKPEILFLDEPTTGIDVAGARQLRQLIWDLNQTGTTIFLTTHYIEEAERLCHRIAFIVSGRIVKIDETENLLQPLKEKHGVELVCRNMATTLLEQLEKAFPDLDFALRGPDRIHVASRRPIRVGPVIRVMEDAGATVMEARRLRPSLEEVFVAVTGIEASTMQQEREKKGGKGK